MRRRESDTVRVASCRFTALLQGNWGVQLMTFDSHAGNQTKGLAFFQELAKIASTFFHDPLTDVTRKRQTSLLLVSLLTILVALSLITITESNPGGFKVTVESQRTIKYVLSLVTFYFIAVYVLSAFQDLKAYYYAALAVEASLIGMENEVVTQVVRESAEIEARLAEEARIIEQRQAVLAAREARIDDLKRRIAEQKQKLQENQNDPSVRAHISELETEHTRESNDYPKFDDKLEDRQRETSARVFDNKTIKQLELLLTTLQTQRGTSKARQLIEIAAPVVLAIGAIGLAVWSLTS